MEFSVSDANKRLIVKAGLGAILVFLSKLAQGDWSILVGALILGAIAFFTQVQTQTAAGAKPKTGLESWMKHIG